MPKTLHRCPRCDGRGVIYWNQPSSQYEETEYYAETCPDCNGLGKVEVEEKSTSHLVLCSLAIVIGVGALYALFFLYCALTGTVW